MRDCIDKVLFMILSCGAIKSLLQHFSHLPPRALSAKLSPKDPCSWKVNLTRTRMIMIRMKRCWEEIWKDLQQYNLARLTNIKCIKRWHDWHVVIIVQSILCICENSKPVNWDSLQYSQLMKWLWLLVLFCFVLFTTTGYDPKTLLEIA